MKYYKLLRDDEKSKTSDVIVRIETGYEEKYGVTKNTVYLAKPIDNWNSGTEFTYSASEGNVLTDFVPNNLGWYIVSKKVQSIFSKLEINSEIQFLPIILKETESGNTISGYSVMNFLNKVSAFDHENSEYKELKAKGKSVFLIKKYSLIESKINQYHCIKIPENEFATFLSDYVVQEMVVEEISGIDFLEIQVN